MRQRVRSHGAKSTIDNNHLRLLLDPVDGKQFVVTIGAAMQYDEESRPNFAAPIYPAPSGRGITVPADAPPLFLLAANDDPMGGEQVCLSIPRGEMLVTRSNCTSMLRVVMASE